MKRINYWIDCAAGEIEGNFIVEDDTTQDEIENIINDKLNVRFDFDVEEEFEDEGEYVDSKRI